MGDASFTELLVVLAIGLVVLGPERLPRIANQIGRWVGQARRMTRVMKRQLEDELNFDQAPDIKPPARSRHVDPGTYKPPPAPATPEPEAGPAVEHDDTWSPAHDADSPGTGVSQDEPAGEPEFTTSDGADRKEAS